MKRKNVESSGRTVRARKGSRRTRHRHCRVVRAVGESIIICRVGGEAVRLDLDRPVDLSTRERLTVVHRLAAQVLRRPDAEAHADRGGCVGLRGARRHSTRPEEDGRVERVAGGDTVREVDPAGIDVLGLCECGEVSTCTGRLRWAYTYLAKVRRVPRRVVRVREVLRVYELAFREPCVQEPSVISELRVCLFEGEGGGYGQR